MSKSNSEPWRVMQKMCLDSSRRNWQQRQIAKTACEFNFNKKNLQRSNNKKDLIVKRGQNKRVSLHILSKELLPNAKTFSDTS